MFNIRRNLIVGFIFLAFVFVSCATNHSEQSSMDEPEWVRFSDMVYPHSAYLTGRGTGKTKSEAQRAAEEEISRAFGSEVLSSTTSKQSFSTKGGNTSEASDTGVEIKTRVYTQLFDLKSAEPYMNPKTKRWEALVYIDRAQAWKIYKPRLEQNIAMFRGLTGAAQTERNAAKKYRLLSNAQGASSETIKMLNYAVVIAPAQSKNYESVRKEIAALPASLSKMAIELGWVFF